MSLDLMYSAKGYGKRQRMSELLAEREAAGEWILVASPTRGLRCSRCDRVAEDCKGSCIDARREGR